MPIAKLPGLNLYFERAGDGLRKRPGEDSVDARLGGGRDRAARQAFESRDQHRSQSSTRRRSTRHPNGTNRVHPVGMRTPAPPGARVSS